VPYVLTAPILGIAGKKFGPSRVLPVMMFCFGFSTLMIVAVKNFGGLMACRWFLGMVSSITVYTSSFAPKILLSPLTPPSFAPKNGL
jgi:predicted MFS family arabinose efflux permease